MKRRIHHDPDIQKKIDKLLSDLDDAKKKRENPKSRYPTKREKRR
jgi:hypothetical protein